LVEAQRFPWDFDGIVSIAPDSESQADTTMRQVWKYRNLLSRDGHPVLSRQDLQLLHAAVLKSCDLTDGVKDGIVGDPLGCQFDPGVLACHSGQQTGCLTEGQVQAVRNVYSGPITSKGVRISTRGVLPGSEMGWEVDSHSADEVEEFYKYVLFAPAAAGPAWTIWDFDFDRDYQRLGAGAAFTDNNPDLRRFKAAGGKLLVAQGGTDAAEIPGAIFDYYDTVERTMGGRGQTLDFFRLFMVPGMNHCSAGEGAFAVDYLSYLESWVEQGHAPDVMVGAHVKSEYLLANGEDQEGDDQGRIWWAAFKLVFPLDAGVPVEFTRAMYPYPLVARYKGKGDVNDARNFGPVGPAGK
jgi:feruloyl esterase